MNSLKRLYFRVVRHSLRFIAKLIGPIHAPFTHKRLEFIDYLTASNELRAGDIILTRTVGEFTTAIIPGYWKHAAVYIGQGTCIEATSKGVHENYLANIIMRTDNVAILRVKDASRANGELIAEKAVSFRGLPYDYEMDIGDKGKVFCSEIVFHSVNFVFPNFLQLWMRLGYPTFTPDDIYQASDKFEHLWENKA